MLKETIMPASKHELPGDIAPRSGAEICLASIKDKLSILSSDTLNYGRVCIYKVPDKHRNKNPEAYTPRLISIGLIHYGDNQVQAMEEYKLKYLSNFLHTFRIDLEELVKYVDGQEKLVCCCYEDAYVRYVSENKSNADTYVRYVSGNNPKVPSEVILLDGIFIVELFLKNHYVELRENGDMLFDNSWISNEILHDLLLFENQLPFRFLSMLYGKFVFNNLGKWLGDESIHPPSFDELTHKYFKDVGNTGKLPLRQNAQNARHFVEFLSILHEPSEKQNNIRLQMGKKVESKSDFTKSPNATDLKAVGVKFKKGSANCLLDVVFDIKGGVLEIPPLTVNHCTETFFRNVIAFEQSGCYRKYATSLIILLDNLIDTSKDVDILVKHGIIENQFGNHEQLAALFNTVYKEFVPDPNEFHFVEECRQLNAYNRNQWHKMKAAVDGWFAMLKRDYFSSPWSIISVIAAFIVLGLTATQTGYAIKG